MDAPVWAAAPELLLDDPSPVLGRQIGSYRVVEEIGRGGMGVVYAAEDERLGRMVAIKVLPPEYTRDPARRARLTREARAAAALSHPAIATIYTLEGPPTACTSSASWCAAARCARSWPTDS